MGETRSDADDAATASDDGGSENAAHTGDDGARSRDAAGRERFTEDPGDVVGRGGDSDGFGYEIAGGVVAWLGFIFTPLVTAVPASYLALKLRESNPGAYYGILAVVAATCVFWVVVVFAPEILSALLGFLAGGSLTVVVLVAPVVVLFVAVAGLVYVLGR